MSAMRFWRDADSCRVSRRPAFCKRRWMGCRAWRPSRLVTATARWQRAVARPSIASIGPNPARPQAVETAATLAGGLSLGGHGRHGQAPVQSSRLGRLGRLGQLGQWSHLGQLSRCGRHGYSGGCRGKRQRRGWRGCWHWRSHGDSAGRCLLLGDNRLLMRDFGKCWERANINQEIAAGGGDSDIRCRLPLRRGCHTDPTGKQSARHSGPLPGSCTGGTSEIGHESRSRR